MLRDRRWLLGWQLFDCTDVYTPPRAVCLLDSGWLNVRAKVLVKKLETSQRAMERKMLNVKLKDGIRNTINRQRTGVTDIVQYVTNTK